MQEITVTYESERFRFDNDVGISTVRYVDGDRPDGVGVMFTIKGPLDEPFQSRGTYRLYGKWTSYKNKRTGETEQQFTYQTWVEAQPADRAGVIAYLINLGKGSHLGRVRATTLWEKFGAQAVEVCRETPEVAAAAVKGWSEESAIELAAKLREKQHTERATMDLMSLFEKRGFQKSLVQRCIRLWGNEAADHVKRNPYLLMQFKGCGFRLCDAMYLDLGLSPTRLKRQALCAWYSIASNTDGHTWYPADFVIQGIRTQVSSGDLRIRESLQLAKRAGMLATKRTIDRGGHVVSDDGQHVWFAETKSANNEDLVCRVVTDSISESVYWPSVEDSDKLSDHQRGRLAQATKGTICSLGGSPGTGKTYSAAILIRRIIDEHGSGAIGIAAPTGKAAVRVTENLQAYGIGLRAKTIHSLLGVETGEDGWTFKHHESNPLPYRYIVIDEASMLDTDLTASLLRARAAGTHVLFVGDVNQLPPVGHGAPLRDMIRAGIPYGGLTEIRRNSGQIVQACAEIRDGKQFEVCVGKLDDEDNLGHLHCTTPEEQSAAIIRQCEQAEKDGHDPIWDVQVIVPLNKKSKVSRAELNKSLQLELNSNPGIQGTPFRLADKIVNTINGFYTAIEYDDLDEETTTNDRGEVYVANGELAEVVEASVKWTVAKLTNPDRLIRIPRGQSNSAESESNSDKPQTGCAWDLGYALSCHKSQGSEWPIVLVVIDEYPGARMVCDRAWVYTAISRAKERCYLIGKLETAYRFCRTTKMDSRKTFLAETIQLEHSKLLLSEI